jgi:hypothetical protein
MTKKRRRPDPSPPEVVSSSEQTISSGEDTDSSPSPPPTQAPRGTPERSDHHARRNDRSSPRRQPVDRVGPPRPRPSNSGRQMTRLDVDWEVRQLERFRRQQPESFGRGRAAVRPEPPPARASTGYSRSTTLARARRLEELTSMGEHSRIEAIRGLRERGRQARAATFLAYDNARTKLRSYNTTNITLTLHLIRTPTLSITPRQSTSPHSHY